MKNIIPILFLLITQICFSQNKYNEIYYDSFLKLKVDENRFDFGWVPEEYQKTPCFRDYTKNELQMQLKDPKTNSIIYTSKEPKQKGIKIKPSKIQFDKQNKKLKISGKLTGAWKNVIPIEYEIYIGHRNDNIIDDIKLSPDLHRDIFYNGEKLTKTIVVDQVPAFYLSNFKKFGAFRGKKNNEILFDIETEFDEKSFLIFGLSSRYAEIFEIGKLLRE